MTNPNMKTEKKIWVRSFFLYPKSKINVVKNRSRAIAPEEICPKLNPNSNWGAIFLRDNYLVAPQR